MPVEVALRKESVDRNCHAGDCTATQTVALRKESVDRNTFLHPLVLILPRSLSARRAWIEIADELPSTVQALVALRKESVDRN